MADDTSKENLIQVRDFCGLGSSPIWAITLPKPKFLELFENKKGKWPTGAEIRPNHNSAYIYWRFGYNLPFSVNGVPEPASYSQNDIKVILPPEYFLKNNKYAGGIVLGDIYSPVHKRNLELEVIKEPFISFSLDSLPTIIKVRESTLREAGIENDLNNVTYDMTMLINYFSGQFIGKTKQELISEISSRSQTLVNRLRYCSFKEDLVEDDINFRKL